MEKNFRFLAFVLFFALCCGGIGCNNSPSPQKGAKASIFQSKEEKEARQYFLEGWNSRFRKCGDSYYGELVLPGNPDNNAFDGTRCGSDVILEMNTSPDEWEIQPLVLSDADRANKIRWACDLTIKARTSSYFDKADGIWSKYWNGTGAFWMMKFRGTDPFMPILGGERVFDVPIVFQVVEYEDGEHNAVFSTQYQGNIGSQFYQHLVHCFDSISPVVDCSSLPYRH